MAQIDKVYAQVMKKLGGKFTQVGLRLNYDQYAKRNVVAKRAEAMLRAEGAKKKGINASKKITDVIAKRASKDARLRKIVNWDTKTQQWVDGTGRILAQDEALKIMKAA